MVRLIARAGALTATADITIAAGSFQVGIDVAGNDVRGISKATAYTNTVALLQVPSLGSRIKFFGASTIADAVANQTSTGSHESEPFMCFKSVTQAQVIARLNVITAPEWWTCPQEVDRYVPGSLSWTQYNATNNNIRAWADAHPNGHLMRLHGCGTNYQQRTNGPTWQNIDITPLDGIGLDTYSPRDIAPFTAQKMFAEGLAWYTAAKAVKPGIIWHTPEYGITRTTTGGAPLDPAVRLAAFQAHLAYYRSVGGQGLNLWTADNSDTTGDWSIDKAGDQAIAAWWASQIQA